MSKLPTFGLFLVVMISSLQLAAQQYVIPYRSGELWGMCDATGKILLEPEFDFVGSYYPSDGTLLYAEKDHKWGLFQGSHQLTPIVFDRKARPVMQCAIFQPVDSTLEVPFGELYLHNGTHVLSGELIRFTTHFLHYDGTTLVIERKSGLWDVMIINEESIEIDFHQTFKADSIVSRDGADKLIVYSGKTKSYYEHKYNSKEKRRFYQPCDAIEEDAYYPITEEIDVLDSYDPAPNKNRSFFWMRDNQRYSLMQVQGTGTQKDTILVKQYHLSPPFQDHSFDVPEHQRRYLETVRFREDRYQIENHPLMYVVYTSGEKMGVITSFARIQPEFESLKGYYFDRFKLPIFVAVKEGKYGVMDARGTILLPFEYDSIQPLFTYLKVWFIVTKAGFYGLHGTQLEEVLPMKYDRIYAPVIHGDTLECFVTEKDGLYGYHPGSAHEYSKADVIEPIFRYPPVMRSIFNTYSLYALFDGEKFKGWANKQGLEYFKD